MSQSKPELKLDWCSYKAAKYAVEHWHYSKRMPVSKLVRVGVWEEVQFIGAIIFGSGASPAIGNPYKLSQVAVCELVRVALREHKTSVSRIISIALKKLQASCPRMRLVVSFADPHYGHHGGIYQAMNWIFTGTSNANNIFISKQGKEYHGRNVGKIDRYDKYGITIHAREKMVGVEKRPGKYRYLYPLDKAMQEQIAPLAQPYPKRATSIVSDALGVQPGEGGVNPTVALQDPA